MTKKKAQDKFQIGSIKYKHDPEAAKQWYEAYVELVKTHLLNKTSK
ncbi:hypothetical protein [Guptibacillus hwajinpoensis]|uniref:Uncharacterized protein n=1 Tax=Guptibacillus hwajinpoensis TaxID=208199 RepID=A0ABU0K068_9BACL|nr:hypothetical protein [Alkalihalobacillus hemicentroti]MDQ0481527.1 hypothetical protein [Alkalihalobacillus hemicentroti]